MSNWYIDEADEGVTQDHDPQDIWYYGIDVKNHLAPGDSVATAKCYQAASGAELAPVAIDGTQIAYQVTPATPGVVLGSKLGLTFEWTTTLGARRQRTVWLNVKEM